MILTNKIKKLGAHCTRHSLHFLHIFNRSLQIFSHPTVLKMQSSSSKNVAIDNLHSSASHIFGFFKSSSFNVGWNKSSSSVFMLKLPSSNFPENPQGAPNLYSETMYIWLYCRLPPCCACQM